jgi:hypothetical protein
MCRRVETLEAHPVDFVIDPASHRACDSLGHGAEDEPLDEKRERAGRIEKRRGEQDPSDERDASMPRPVTPSKIAVVAMPRVSVRKS